MGALALLVLRNLLNTLNKMNEGDIKLLLMNAASFTISLSQVEIALKILLLAFSIGYTAQRWYLMNKNK